MQGSQRHPIRNALTRVYLNDIDFKLYTFVNKFSDIVGRFAAKQWTSLVIKIDEVSKSNTTLPTGR